MTIAPLALSASAPPGQQRPDLPAPPPTEPRLGKPDPEAGLVPRPAPASLVQSLWQTPGPATVPPPDRVLEPYGILMLPADRSDPG